MLQNELSAKEKNITVLLEPTTSASQALSADSQQRFRLLNGTPNGVIRMSDAVKGVVETSLNVGVVTTSENEAEIIA